jgi:diacylglycerol kinase family enzyme
MPGAVQRIAVVYNPSSGRISKAIEPSDIKRLLPSGVALEWIALPLTSSLRIELEESLTKGFDLVLAAGGDGTVMTCASVLLGKKIPLGILPHGTGNVLASSLGIPRALPRALDIALHGEREWLDLGRANGKCFTLIAGLGADAAIFARTNTRLKARVGLAAYLIGSRALLSLRPDTFEIQIDGGKPVIRRAYGVMVGNLSRFRAVQLKWPGASSHDARFEIALIRSHPALGSVLAAEGRLVEWFMGQHIAIRSSRSHLLERDGDVDGLDTLLDVSIIPRGIAVCTPRIATTKSWRTVFDAFSAPH